MRLRRRRFLLICAALAIAAVAWVVWAGPMLLHIRFGPMRSDPQLAIWNPVRNRHAERCGAEYLRRIQSPACEREVAGLDISSEERAEACDKQSRHPVTTPCSLVERRDRGSFILLIYSCHDKMHNDVTADIALTLEHRNGAWLLSNYQRID
jgi:hypothetical protein